MRIGFTGTRAGMSDAQKIQFALVMSRLRPVEFHHGGASGADDQAWRYVELNSPTEIHWHPTFGAVDAAAKRHRIWNAFPPLKRNRDIVDACDLLVAAPLTDKEQQRSGTWATVRYARQAGKPVVMLSRGQ